MAWYAKPSGSYGYNSEEGKANIYEINSFFNYRGYTLESQAGILGNVEAESGFNPWRWQSDEYDLTGGYGLFQYTPARGYINGCSHLAHYAPNLSVTEITDGADPSDGIAQLTAFADNTLGKWMGTCWRPYWDKTTYSELYALRNLILSTYGNRTSLSLEQFMHIDNVYYATFAFLACFEGPLVPSMDIRYKYASDIFETLTGDTPDNPFIPKGKRKMPIWMMLRPF